MTPSEAVTTLWAFYSQTVDYLGGTEWQALPRDANVLGHVPEECTLPNGTVGVRYSAARHGPGQADPKAAAEIVAKYWNSLGLEAVARVPNNPKDPQFIAVGVDATINARYTVDTVGSAITLVGACVPGDQEALLDGVIKHREMRSASPKPSSPQG